MNPNVLGLFARWTSLLYWGAQSLGYGPSTLQPLDQRWGMNTRAARPLFEGQRVSIVSHEMIDASVAVLLAPSSPLTVPGRVRAIVVDAINAVLRRGASPHVSIEPSEVIPFRADGDAPSTVIPVSNASHVLAARSNPHPDRIFRDLEREPMLYIALTGHLRSLATARRRVPIGEIAALHRCDSATFASAKPSPHVWARPIRIFGNHCQVPELLAGSNGKLRLHRDLPLIRNRGARPDLLVTGAGRFIARIIP